MASAFSRGCVCARLFDGGGGWLGVARSVDCDARLTLRREGSTGWPALGCSDEQSWCRAGDASRDDFCAITSLDDGCQRSKLRCSLCNKS